MTAPPDAYPPTRIETTLNLLHDLFVASESSEPSLEAAHRIHVLLRALTKQTPGASFESLMPRIRSQIAEALRRIRRARNSLHAQQPHNLTSTHAKLDEVTKTTESATMDMLNGLDRTLAAINGLEAAPDAAGFESLRGEVNRMYMHLQFQDIVTQQLAGITQSIVDLEREIVALAEVFSADEPGPDYEMGTAKDPESYNAHASIVNVAERQAVADQTISRSRRIS